MRANKILFFSLAAALMAGCADDDYVVNSIKGEAGVNGKLVEAGLLGVGRENNGAETRAFNPDGKFVWMPTNLDTDGSLLSPRGNQRIGMCWTGVDEGGYGAVTAADQKVYTNYEYEHVGWLDEKATEPATDPCNASVLLNGAYIVSEGTPAANYTGSTLTGGRWNKYYQTGTTGSYTPISGSGISHPEATGVLDLGTGVFSTKNASVFQGEYLVYFPYTKAFTKGQILANEPTVFDVDLTADRYAAASENAFSIGYIPNYKGGSAVSKIKAKTLNGFVIAKLYNYNSAAVPTTKTLKKVIFYSETEGIVYEQDLNAAKCVAALKTPAADIDGASLYYTGADAKKSKTNAVVANLKNGAVSGTTTAPSVDADYMWVALPVLPQTFSDLKVILIDDNEMSCTLDMDAVALNSNKVLAKEINLATCVFKNEYLAVDEDSFLAAMAKIKAGGSDAENKDANTVKLLKNIKLTMTSTDYVGSGKYAGIYNSLFFDKNITIFSKCDAKLVIAADTYVNIKNTDTAVASAAADRTPVLTIDVPVEVEGAGCCDNYPAKLSVGGTQTADKVCTVIFKKNIDNFGTLALGNNANGNTKVTVEGKITNKLDEFAVIRSKTTDAAQLYILGGELAGNNVVTINEIDNEGAVNVWRHSIAVTATSVTFDPTHASSHSSIASQRVATATVGTLTNQGTVEIGENMLVNVTTNFQNENATSLVKTVGKGYSAIDGKLDVKASSAANAGTIDNTGVINFTRTNLANTGLFIDRTNGQIGGYKVNNGTRAAGDEIVKSYATNPSVQYTTDLGVQGIYVAQVKTVARMAKVLSDAVLYPSTVIVEILDCDDAYNVFNLANYKYDLTGKDVKVNPETDTQIVFKAFKKIAGVNTLVEKCFGHCVEVNKATLLLKDGLLSTERDVEVMNSSAALKTAQASTSYDGETTVTVGRDLTAAGNVTHDAILLTVNHDLNVNAMTFTSNGKFAVTGAVKVATGATFDSNGDDNTAGSFTTSGTTTFAKNTSSDVAGLFECLAGTFEREGLDSGTEYRATVNVGSLGSLNGTTSTAWPTVR